jgi:hypothetical protein
MTELEKFLKDSFVDCRQGQWSLLGADGGLAQFSLRKKMLEGYCFAVLTEEMIDKIKPYGPILEVGAGTGYWAYEFKKRGVDYLATDVYALPSNKYFLSSKAWEHVYIYTTEDAIKRFPNRTLLMCWPGYRESWAYEALNKYKGNIFIYAGEKEGGCCADDDFFKHLNRYWKEIKTLDMPQFFGLHDTARIFKRNKRKEC